MVRSVFLYLPCGSVNSAGTIRGLMGIPVGRVEPGGDVTNVLDVVVGHIDADGTIHGALQNSVIGSVDEQGHVREWSGNRLGATDPADGLVLGGGAALLLLFANP